MKESTNKKPMCQNTLCTTTHWPKTNSIANFISLLPEKIADFYNPSHLNHIKLTTKLSVRKLRACYVSSPGEKEK